MKTSNKNSFGQSAFANLNFEDTAQSGIPFGTTQAPARGVAAKNQTPNSKVLTDTNPSESAITSGMTASSDTAGDKGDSSTNHQPLTSNVQFSGDPGKKSRRSLWLTLAIVFLLLGAAGLIFKKGYDLRLAQIERNQALQEQVAEQTGQNLQNQFDAMKVKVRADSVETGDLSVTGESDLRGGAKVTDDTTVDGNVNVNGDVTANNFQGSMNGSSIGTFSGDSSGTFQGSGTDNFQGNFSGDGSNLDNVDAVTLYGNDSSFSFRRSLEGPSS